MKEEASVETEVEKAGDAVEKKMLMQQIQYFGSNKNKLDTFLKEGAKDMEKKAFKVIDTNPILPVYWTMIKSVKKANDLIDKTKQLQDRLKGEQLRLSDPDARIEAAKSVKEINLQIAQSQKEKKELDIVSKNLDKQIKEKIQLLKQQVVLH